MNKRIVLTIIFSIAVFSISAQVTVGSDVLPVDGALLDIKQQVAHPTTNVTATKGFVLPRVELTSKTSLAPLTADNAANRRSHVGLTVYNLNEVPGTASIPTLHTGLNVWTGEAWTPVNKQSAPNFFYMPSFTLDISSTGAKTVNLYDVYRQQFSPRPTNARFSSSAGNTTQIPGVYSRYDLTYAVLDYDPAIIAVTNLTPAGLLSYTVISTTAPSSSYITVVCVVK